MRADQTATTPDQQDRPDAPRRDEPYLFVVLECDRPLAGGARFALGDADQVAIGRGAARRGERSIDRGRRLLDLRLPSALLSTAHARITRDGNDWVLEDTNSRNGTYVNGHSAKRETLRDGDVIELGHILARFRILPASGPPTDIVEPPSGPLAFATLLPTLGIQLHELTRLASSMLPILLLGETGTGKELVARGIHELSGRPGPIIAVNCGALSGTLLDSQLFGHLRGSFTGALRDEPGFVRASDHGTLFLDEIGDLPATAQAALLRVLQEREVVPVGSTKPVKVDLRVVAATHRQLDLLSARGTFRADLYARLSGHVHYLTPLRDRREDLGLIVAALLARDAPEGRELRFSADAGRDLLAQNWSLNIRQLEQSLSRAVMLADNGLITNRHLVAPLRTPGEGMPIAVEPARAVDDDARAAELRSLLERHHGNVSEVARAMGVSRMQIHRLMQRYSLDVAAFRRGD